MRPSKICNSLIVQGSENCLVSRSLRADQGVHSIPGSLGKTPVCPAMVQVLTARNASHYNKT